MVCPQQAGGLAENGEHKNSYAIILMNNREKMIVAPRDVSRKNLTETGGGISW
jgi:hypothetical protein